MEGLMRLGGLEEQFAQISDTSIPFLEMLHQCIEPNHQILQSLLHQNQTIIKQDPGQTDDPEKDPETHASPPMVVVKEKRKRKRTRAPKNKDEIENQRRTHINVERNRRKQMNEHLNALKSLMPPSFLQRGDQASIVGGAIDFIKELEQLLQSLESEKETIEKHDPKTSSSSSSSSTTVSSILTTNTTELDGFTARFGGGETAAEVEATVIQNHVSLKIRCKRRGGNKGQILKAIVSIEALKLSVLHLTISSSFEFLFYSFNLKIEDGCKVGSADEITRTVHQIFEQINGEMMWSNIS